MSADPRPSPAPGQTWTIQKATDHRGKPYTFIDGPDTDLIEVVASRPLPAAGLEVDHALKRLEKLIDSPYAGGLQDFMQRAAVRVRELRVAVDRPLAAGLSEFVAAYDAWQIGKAEADIDGDWLRIAPLYDAMVAARAALVRLASAPNREEGDG